MVDKLETPDIIYYEDTVLTVPVLELESKWWPVVQARGLVPYFR